MAEIKTYTAKKNGSLFVQKNGANTEPQYVGCYDLDDITENEGSLEPVYCFDENGNYTLATTTQSAPDLIELTLGTYIGKTKEFIEQAKCPWNLIINLSCDGFKDDPINFERQFIIEVIKVTGRTLMGLVKRNEDMVAEVSFTATGKPFVIDTFQLTGQGNRQTVTHADDITGITFNSQTKCLSTCAPLVEIVCSSGMIVGRDDGVNPNVPEFTTDGETWTPGATAPFTGLDLAGAVRIDMGGGNVRWITSKAEADASAAEIAYSDDDGATWTSAPLTGSSVGDFIGTSQALFYQKYNRIWSFTQVGAEVFLSSDRGQTWTQIEDGTIFGVATGAAIHFKDELTGIAVGSGATAMITQDGGSFWQAITVGASAVDFTDVHYNGKFWWIIGNGEMWYSTDGLTWTQRTGWTGAGSAGKMTMDWSGELVGVVTHSVGGVGYVLMTTDGGYNWWRIPLSTATVLNDVWLCGTDIGYIAGDVQSGTGYVSRITAKQ